MILYEWLEKIITDSNNIQVDLVSRIRVVKAIFLPFAFQIPTSKFLLLKVQLSIFQDLWDIKSFSRSYSVVLNFSDGVKFRIFEIKFLQNICEQYERRKTESRSKDAMAHFGFT